MSRTKKIWTVDWTHDSERCVIGDDTLSQICHFASKREAELFSIGKRYYSADAKPFCSDVPVHIARRWGF